MKKYISLLAAAVMAVTMTACSGADNNSPETADNVKNEVSSTVAASGNIPVQDYFQSQSKRTQLANLMTPLEAALVHKRKTVLFDDLKDREPEVAMGMITYPREELLKMYEGMKLNMPDYFASEDEYRESVENCETYSEPFILINGTRFRDVLLTNANVGETVQYFGKTFTDDQSFFDEIRTQFSGYGYDKDSIAYIVSQTELILKAIRSDNYEKLPDHEWKYGEEQLPRINVGGDERKVWAVDADSMRKLRTCTDEIVMYDQELATTFVAEVTTPPNYDSSKAYPVLFMTDAVWRLNDHAALRKAMEDGESAPVILVSLGYNYDIDGTDELNRFTHLIEKREQLLSFITDNLMPYISESYNIDCSNSTLFGHSMAGVFAHTALFESDKCGDNQPFGNYIIASPVFWQLYSSQVKDLDAENAMNDYGYFDRNKTLDKNVLIFGGSLEDPDYADSFDGHDSTLTGISKLEERLRSHGASFYSKLYESHHYQYVSDMLLEFLKAYYPNK